MNTKATTHGTSDTVGTPCFAYVRVSTAKQREHSVSLEAQREAIERYAHRNGLVITEWFSESQTAAKRGRKEFNRMLDLLRQGKARGVIVHKIDRSARNLKDWADFAELTDRGIVVHFAAEALDLSSRGGRLSADIQAVVAADYIRNLRQEALKGIRGRLQQGLFPGRAPLGYLDNGSGELKTIDPVRGPLVRDLFECYATGRYSLDTLVRVMTERGLTNTAGGALTKNTLSKVLNNPFYTGLIVVRRTSETFEGRHEPLITRALFDAVQANLRGNTRRPKGRRHTFTFSRLVRCGLCGYSLVAERQKGFVYYRCHTSGCPLKCTREEEVDDAIRGRIAQLNLTEEECEGYLDTLGIVTSGRREKVEGVRSALEIELGKTNERLGRLGDLVLDGVFSGEDYQEKKRLLLEKRQRLTERIAGLNANLKAREARVRKFFERAKMASLSYEKASPLRKREMVEMFTSNRVATPENLFVELQKPFQAIADREVVIEGGPSRDVPRTHTPLIAQLLEHAEDELKPEGYEGEA